MSLRIVFMGTPDFSVPTLRALHAAGHDICCCYTQPPRPAGRRGLDLKPSPVQLAAQDLGLPIRSPKNFRDEDDRTAFGALKADVGVVVAYGLLLPKALLDAPRHGCFNGHASLLPRWRGAAPIQRAIMAGDRETGMMIMKMDEGLDTGPIAMTTLCDIDETTTAGTLHDRLSDMGADLMVQAMALLEDGELTLKPQAETGATYASKIDKSETRVDWSKPASSVARQIMGLSPFPGAWFEGPQDTGNTRVKVLEAKALSGTGDPGECLDDALTIACGEGAVQLLTLQKAGGRVLDAATFLRGNPVAAGTRLA